MSWKGRDQGLRLRVLRREVQVGARADRGKTWLKLAVVRPDVTSEELEALWGLARKKIRELEDEELEPSLREARRLTMAELWKAYRMTTCVAATASGRPGLWSSGTASGTATSFLSTAT